MATWERKSGSRRGRSGPGPRGREWVGGQLLSPFYVTEGGPYRPEIILWLELPEDLIVSFTLLDPKGPAVSLADSLSRAMEAPIEGPPRRPSRIRVADALSVLELQRVFPDLEIVKAPTPELNRVLEAMAAAGASGGEEQTASYFESEAISAELLERLFSSAKVLHHLAPWKVASDHQVLRLDIPGLGVEGACLSIIGALGRSLGFVIFPSLIAFERFVALAQSGEMSAGPLDMGSSALSLTYLRGADLPAPMVREVMEHGWPLASPDAYPIVSHRDRDGLSRPLTERDVRVVSACAASLASFSGANRRLFTQEVLDEPVCVSFFDDDDLEVRFTMPYEAAEMFAVNARPPANRIGQLRRAGAESPRSEVAREPGRNDPCPCGSGRKYKKCCQLRAQDSEHPAGRPAAIHQVDQRLVESMTNWAFGRFGAEWREPVGKTFDDPEASRQLAGPWMIHHVPIDGKPLAQWFLEERGDELSRQERTWLEAQGAAWLSIWEVLDAEPGRSLRCRDLLTGEERQVREATASKSVPSREALLGRIVDHDGISVLGGIHPRSLPPLEADALVQRIRGRLRRRRAVPVDRLRGEEIGRYMIRCWEEEVERLDQRLRIPPRLQNTDGEDLLLTADHFDFDPRHRREIEDRLAAIEGVIAPDREGPKGTYTFVRAPEGADQGWGETMIGCAVLSANKLRLETNSMARADRLRAQLEAATGGLIRHRVREHSDPIGVMRNPGNLARAAAGPDPIPSDEKDRLILEMKARHYAGWADHALPALDGRTPREAVRTEAGRRRVDLLLKDCENAEARGPERQRFDFAGLRGELGLGE